MLFVTEIFELYFAQIIYHNLEINLFMNIVFLSQCDQKHDFHSDQYVRVKSMPLVCFDSYVNQHKYIRRDITDGLMVMHQMLVNGLDDDIYTEQGAHNFNLLNFLDRSHSNPTERDIDIALSEIQVLQRIKYVQFSEAAKCVYFMLKNARDGHDNMPCNGYVYNTIYDILINHRLVAIDSKVLHMVAYFMQNYILPRMQGQYADDIVAINKSENIVMGLVNVFNTLYNVKAISDESFYHLVYSVLFAVDVAFYEKYGAKLFVQDISIAMTENVRVALEKLIRCIQIKHYMSNAVKQRIRNIQRLFQDALADCKDVSRGRIHQLISLCKALFLSIGYAVTVSILYIFLTIGNIFYYFYYYYIIKLRHRKDLLFFVS